MSQVSKESANPPDLSGSLLDKAPISQSPLPVIIPNLLDKIDLWVFLYFSFGICPFVPQIWIFFIWFIAWFLEVFCMYFNTDNNISSVQSQKWILMTCTSCKTSYNVLSHNHVIQAIWCYAMVRFCTIDSQIASDRIICKKKC